MSWAKKHLHLAAGGVPLEFPLQHMTENQDSSSQCSSCQQLQSNDALWERHLGRAEQMKPKLKTWKQLKIKEMGLNTCGWLDW